ncbi:MAG TPA: GNAT family N-acetyltransferase [Chloroflexaceae bacterium]|nr:GNAT family N-acetyltransferase [Chloroflexaceae bacterium]
MSTIITLQAVTAENWRAVGELRVRDEQADYVAPNLYSLVEAAYGFPGELAHLVLTPLAVYAGLTLVGFTLYNSSPALNRFFIMRLMVDQRYQGQGYGSAAVRLLLQLFQAHPQATEAAISYNAGNVAARQVYLRCGFEELPTENEGEVLMWRTLNPHPKPWTSLWNPAWAGR